MSVTRSHSLSIGIVGLPNSGKSTIFNALTKSAVPAENYPFCTIDKNVGVVKIPDKRLDKLAKHCKSEKVVPSAMTFVDIAGLVKGASKGEGLGNKFLSHIREVSAIMYVLRAFKNDNISHVYDKIDPVEDLRIVRSELILKDIETVDRKLGEVKGMAKGGASDDVKENIACLEKVLDWLNDENPAYNADLTQDERDYVHELWLLTDKPAFYVLNMKGGVDEPEFEKWRENLRKIVPEEEKDFIVAIDCKLEVELEDMTPEEIAEIIDMVDDYHGVQDIIQLAYKRLNLLTFFTGNEKEANTWTVTKGATVQAAAGVIHTDLAETFVVAEIVNVEKMIAAGGWVGSKEAGIVRTEGKDYIVQDGDYVSVLVNK